MRAALSVLILLFGAVHLAGQTSSSPQVAQAPDAQHRAQRVARADQAIAELQATLLARLKAELSAGGPTAAVTVCRDEAQRLTTSIGSKHQLQMGRTSNRLRNPANAPRAWAAAHVAASAGGKAADAKPAIVDLDGGGIGVLRPIGTADFCVMCHGQRDAVQAAIGPILDEAYPEDRAVGFAPGDLRGWFWAEVR